MRIATAIAILGIVLASTITVHAAPMPHECSTGEFAKRFWCDFNMHSGG
ncbi:MAG: hypothetical protein ACK4MF_09795 [Hyphomicrobiaceae bacterium]